MSQRNLLKIVYRKPKPQLPMQFGNSDTTLIPLSESLADQLQVLALLDPLSFEAMRRWLENHLASLGHESRVRFRSTVQKPAPGWRSRR